MPRSRQRRLIVEDAAEMLAVGKHFGLMRQIGAAGVDQIDAWQPVFARDLLRAQMLLHRHRVIGAALDSGIIADDDAFAARDAADAGDDARGIDVVVIEAEGGKRREFEKRRAGIDQRHHPLARQELAASEMAFTGARRTALGGLDAAALELRDKRAHRRLIGAKFLRRRVDRLELAIEIAL